METPEFFQSGCYDAQFTPEECLSDVKNGDHFVVDDFLDFHVDENAAAADGGLEAAMTGDATAVAAVDSSCKSSFCGGGLPPETHFNSAGGQFASELCVPYDDVAELEWLSNFVEESFSSEDLQKLQLIQGTNDRNTDTSGTQQYHFQPEITKPAPKLQPAPPVRSKAARTKRSRAAPLDWTSRLLVVTPTPPPNISGVSPPPEPELTAPKKASKPRKGSPENPSGGEGRRCLHCDTDKTPQWRTGPMGPKTLCNACGVRYKSGRLVPEYRPAASPTFVMAKHSNSHRKVLELRRQKEAHGANQVQQPFLHQQSMMFDDDYLIHQHVGPDFRQLI